MERNHNFHSAHNHNLSESLSRSHLIPDQVQSNSKLADATSEVSLRYSPIYTFLHHDHSPSTREEMTATKGRQKPHGLAELQTRSSNLDSTPAPSTSSADLRNSLTSVSQLGRVGMAT
ncbi:unnamed protein product [Protopolystoma xenopodis]|uniref:Uncharacterized protein n=1 Tax=Protopolystoma xenopodis TaxID=117903 RepID=A0A3S5BQ86_9PLAT|nr:unnamed protein product [Protopolystoma xenopodis]